MRSAVAIMAGWAVFGLAAHGAFAQAPVAIVEDTSDQVTAVQMMDYLSSGQIIQLAATDRITIGYLGSCWREEISGGVVTVGEVKSEIAGGKVYRQKVECDGGRMRFNSQQAGQSGVMVFRGTPGAAAAGQPQLTLYGVSPVVELKAPGKLVIERLDQSGDRQEIDVTASQLVQGRFFDFARSGRSLKSGGTYRASVGTQQVVFRIDARAKSGNVPLAGRLLSF